MSKVYYSTSEVAHFFGINRVTIYRWAKKGAIKSYRIGKHLKIPAAEVERMRREFGLADIVSSKGG
jgi:excisionase family DNA binding protein